MTTATDIETDENGAPTAKGLRDFAERQQSVNANLSGENSGLKKENAFLKAGVNPDSSPSAKDFFEAYKGELTSDAVKAAAMERNLIQEGAPDPAAQQSAATQSAISNVASATTGGGNNAYQDRIGQVHKAVLDADPNGTDKTARMAALTELAKASGMTIVDP